ncbi:hypothetical protein O3Q52_38765 [Streptomyces sp. ActVer]|uniref:hypothetical protein n=1 Tax=Streptomyces sp. ActVer TaxID=3014558 RepID=UPI0022B3C6EB|nr:hypothetical protein [Streptomyces sp. ActVer]MCZ4513978.1 hypothetical protein [Streptomyces sp. ActVer]
MASPVSRQLHVKKQLAGGRLDYGYAYFLVHATVGTCAGAVIAQAGIRWKIEEDNEQGKQLTGLDQYQVRKWIPWHRSVTCTMLAQPSLTVHRALHLDPRAARTNDVPIDPHDTPGPEEPVVRPVGPPREPGPMIRPTFAALAGLLAITGLVVHHDDAELLRQHHWRTEHQTSAAISHYQWRGDPLPAHLRQSDPNRSHQQDLPL